MNYVELTNALAKALSLPPGTTKAVLTLEVGKMPMLAIETYAFDQNAKFPSLPDATKELPKVEFMLRLEPFPEKL